MTQQKTIAFIGAGKMGSSIIGGIIGNGFDPKKIIATNTDNKILLALKKECGIQTTTNNIAAVEQADVVVLALKPQVIPSAIQEIKAALIQKKMLLISIAAGTLTTSLQKWLNDSIPIIRCMPNTPALVRSGISVLFANRNVDKTQKDLAASIFRAVGMVLWIEDEALLNTVTALSGSGPAYFYYIMEAMQEGAIDLGLDKAMAKLLILQTALGSARMALESQLDLKQLRENVTSPGGTTASALSVLEKKQIKQILIEAIIAANTRSIELSKQEE